MNQLYPIHSIKAARTYESSILGEDPKKTAEAMGNAGRAIGSALLEDFQELRPWPGDARILVLVGKGLNSGDAFIACETLFKSLPGLSATLVRSATDDDLNPIAAEALERLSSLMGSDLDQVSADDYLQAPQVPVDVVLDGLFGHGFNPPLQEPVLSLLKQINGRKDISLRVSIDLPSGIGESTDPDAFVADITYVPGVAKEPCFLEQNAAKIGRLRFLELDPFLEQPADASQHYFVGSRNAFKSLNRIRPSLSDKRSYGHCLIMAGSSHMPGAALMSTMGALNAGAGLVTTMAPMNVATQIASAVPEAMWRPLPLSPDGLLDVESVRIVTQLATKAGSLLIGPGLLLDRPTIFSICRIIREVPLPIILDASALTQDIVSAVLGRSLNAGPVILTPHRGEYERLSGHADERLSLIKLMAFSQKYRTVTVLKGNTTHITDGERVVVLPVGGPVLARGGAGDLLSGILATLLAQNPDNPLEVAMQAVSWLGAAGDSLARQRGAIAVKTTDLVPHLAATLHT